MAPHTASHTASLGVLQGFQLGILNPCHDVSVGGLHD